MTELTPDQKFGVTDRVAKLAVEYNGGSPTGYTSGLVDLASAILMTCDELDVIAAINEKINEIVDGAEPLTDDDDECHADGPCYGDCDKEV